jgi:hypothetical protein
MRSSMIARVGKVAACATALAWYVACTPSQPKPEPKATVGGPPQAVRESLEGGPYPTLVLSQAWFWKDAQGKSRPGPARLQIWRQTPHGWETRRVEDADSNVFHKAIIEGNGLLTIGGERAMLKRWKKVGAQLVPETIWSHEWGGRFNRLRDMEIGDVDGDGKDEIVLATHDQGVVAVVHPPASGTATDVVQLDQTPDTFIHEIEIGDVDGDGKLEFYATPSARNRVGVSQEGRIVRYDWDGKTYRRTIVDSLHGTHAKEILVTDIDGDGRSELFAAIEARLGEKGRIERPVEIRQYRRNEAGKWTHDVIATIDDAQCRFLVAADFDGDGRKEVVASAIKTGLYLLDSEKGSRTWKVAHFESNSSGFENAILPADLDGDGRPELYNAADDQHQLNRYVWDSATGAFVKTLIGSLEPNVITWNIAAGKL